MLRIIALGHRTGLQFAAILGCLAFFAPVAVAQEDPLAGVDVVKIEEDWSLDIANPDPAADCPQVVTVFGPSDPSLGTHAIFEINHGTLPDYGEGGMQLQVWHGESLIGYRSRFAPSEFNLAIERLTYTTVSKVTDGYLILYVKNGDSLTWGGFGSGESSLNIVMSTWRTDLNTWDPQNSITHSRVAYGANRVNNYVRTAVRYYIRDEYGNLELHHTDDTDTYVHKLVEDAYAPDPVNE